MLTAQIFPQCLARKQGTLYLASRYPQTDPVGLTATTGTAHSDV